MKLLRDVNAKRCKGSQLADDLALHVFCACGCRSILPLFARRSLCSSLVFCVEEGFSPKYSFSLFFPVRASTSSPVLVVPAGSPSRGGIVAVYDFDLNEPSLPTPLYSVLASISVYGPFNCVSFHRFSRQLSAFSLCSFGVISVSLVISAIYFFMKVSISPDVIL